jgi:hypothetical protein
MIGGYACVDLLVQEIYPFTYVLLSKNTFHGVQLSPFHNSAMDALQYSAPVKSRFRVTDKGMHRCHLHLRPMQSISSWGISLSRVLH